MTRTQIIVCYVSAKPYIVVRYVCRMMVSVLFAIDRDMINMSVWGCKKIERRCYFLHPLFEHLLLGPSWRIKMYLNHSVNDSMNTWKIVDPSTELHKRQLVSGIYFLQRSITPQPSSFSFPLFSNIQGTQN